MIGGEVFFENGIKNPKIEDITSADLIYKTFHHVSNSLLYVKLSYYPFNRFLKGFNIAVGPTAGYTMQSYEKYAERYEASPGYFVRKSILNYKNEFIIGYRVSLGLDFNLDRNWIIGGRADFSSYNNGDINTMLGLKLGYCF